MRYVYQNVVQDGKGNFVAGASVTVSLAGGATAASIYTAFTGGTVDADGVITTGSDGTFVFYVDEDDYPHSQQFRIVWSKSGFTSETWDYIQIFPNPKVKEVILPESYGAKGDGSTDDAAAIQSADDAAAALGMGLVVFSSKDYLIGSKVTKDPYTSWEGALGAQSPQVGTNLVLVYNGTMIQISDSGTQYAGNAGIRKMRLLGDLSSYASGIGIDVTTVPRRQVYEDLYIYGFLSGHRGIIHESYINRCFYSGNIYGLNTSGGGADTFINNCHFGSGLAATGVDNANGLRLNNANNFRFSQCRFQVNEEGSGTATGQGARIKNSTNVYFDRCIFDQNEGYGLYIIDSQDIFVNGISAFDNGSAKANRAGVALFASNVNDSGDVLNFTYDGSDDQFTITAADHGISNIANTRLAMQVKTTDTLPTGLSASTSYFFIRVDDDQFKLAATQEDALNSTAVSISGAGVGTHTLLGVIENIQIQGGRIYDRGNGYQADGIKIIRSSASNEFNNIRISGVDLTGSATPLSSPINNYGGLGVNWRISDCPGLDEQEITATGVTLHPWGTSKLNSTSNAVNSTLNTGLYAGQIKTIVMTEASNSSTVTITNHQTSDPEVATFNAIDETGVFMWTGTEWITIFATCTF